MGHHPLRPPGVKEAGHEPIVRQGARLLLLLLAISLCSCATTDPDPLEPVNRQIFAFNDAVDGAVFKPLAQGYVAVLPGPVRSGVHNIFTNLRTPTTMINQFLQGKPREGGRAAGRFLINTTVGLLGIFDVATGWGFAADREDFGQTLAAWGVPPGPFLMVPFLGPTNARDGVGTFAGLYTYPPTYADDDLVWWLYGIDLLQTRAELLQAEKMLSGDRYLFVRDAYLQRRDALIRDGEAPARDPFLDD